MLPRHATVPIAFLVNRVVDLDSLAVGVDPAAMKDARVTVPYWKDYDAIPSNHPESWPLRFDVSNWQLFGAYDGTTRIGGVVVAWNTPGLDLLPNATDALLWDIRVAPDVRGRGVGTALFAAAESWARHRGSRRLLVETQDTNLGACRFYAAQGCILVSMTRGAYPDFPAETQLLWAKALPASEVQ